MNKLLIASKNPGKIKEYREIFKQLKIPLKILSLDDLNIKENVEEDGKTFKENAVKKVKFYSKIAKIPVLADDGGLEIDYLNGEPGVKSRRWPGYEATDEELVKITLLKLKGVPLKKRGAHLKVVIALAVGKKVWTFEGKLRGVILERKIGKIIPGYPFRSLLYLPGIKKTLGELNMKEEAKIAHRKEALIKGKLILKKQLC